ncbi:MAG: exosortase, partial [Pirellulales bacterium]|nr:exosortase [Pirellulales bacterium]
MSTTAELFEQSINRRRPKVEDSPKVWMLFWALLLAASVPMLLIYLSRMWAIERYQYFPFVFVAFGVLLYQRFDWRFSPPHSWYRWVQVGTAVIAILAASIVRSPWLNTVGFVLLMASFLGSSTDRQGRSLIALVLPLLLLIRLPLGYDYLLVVKLQGITTELSSVMLDLLRVPHSAAANVIRLPSRELFVAEACSGIQSVFTLAFIAMSLITFFRRRIWLTGIYLVIAVLLAIAANMMRVTIVALGEAWHGVDLASGWPHEIVGYAALLTAILLLISFDQLVMTFLHPIDATAEGELTYNPVVAAWNWLACPADSSAKTSGAADPERAESQQNFRQRPLWPRQTWIRGIFLAAISTLLLVSVSQATRLAFVDDGDFTRRSVVRDAVFEVPEDLLASTPFQSMEVASHSVSRGGANPRLGDNADLWDVNFGQQPGQIVLS